MTRWTQQDYDEWAASQNVGLTSDIIAEADEGPESKLQGKIVKYCKNHGYPCLSFRQSKKAEGFLTPGWPDLTICLPHGRVVFLELKAKKGYLSDKQKETAKIMCYLDHYWYKINSYKQFLFIVEAKKGG